MVVLMTPDVLQRFRDGLSSGRFTLTKVAEVSKLGLTQLSYMKNKADWGEGIFEKAKQLEEALDQIEAEASEAPAAKVDKAEGRATSAA